MVIKKAMDPKETTLFQQSLKNGEGLTAEIDLVQPGKKGAPAKIARQTLANVLISGYQVVNGSEIITLDFTSVDFVPGKDLDQDDSDLARGRWDTFNRAR
jgi:type VI protein secretion system component Hcp